MELQALPGQKLINTCPVDHSESAELTDQVLDVVRKEAEGIHTGGEWTLTQWVHCEFIVSFEAIRPVITQQVCGEFF